MLAAGDRNKAASTALSRRHAARPRSPRPLSFGAPSPFLSLAHPSHPHPHPQGIAKETMLDKAPDTMLRPGIDDKDR